MYLATLMAKIVIASKQRHIGDVSPLAVNGGYSVYGGDRKNRMSLPLTVSGGHQWDQSLLGDGKSITDFEPHFKS